MMYLRDANGQLCSDSALLEVAAKRQGNLVSNLVAATGLQAATARKAQSPCKVNTILHDATPFCMIH